MALNGQQSKIYIFGGHEMRKICKGIIVDKDGIEIVDHELTDMFVMMY